MMKNNFFKNIFAGVMLAFTSISNAGMIYDFDISGQTIELSKDFSNYTIVVEFLSSTDYNAVTQSDILNFGYNYSGQDYFTTSIGSQNIQNLFSLSGAVPVLTVGSFPTMAFLSGTIPGLGLVQVGQQAATNIYLSTVSGVISATSDDEKDSFNGVIRSSVSVPEPTTLTIFALGMIGFVSRRFKK